MNVLLFTIDFKPLPGGIAEFGFRLASGLADRGHAVTVLTTKMKGADAFDRERNHRTVRVPAARWVREVAFLVTIPYLALTRRIDVVLCFYWTPCGVIMALLSALLGVPYCLFAFGDEIIDARGSLRRRFPWVKRAAFRQSARIFPISRFTATLVSREGLAGASGRMVLIPGAVDPGRFPPLARAAARACGPPPGLARAGERPEVLSERDRQARWRHLMKRDVILTVSRIVACKGIDTLLEALPGIRCVHPAACAVLVGEGPDRGRLEALALARGLADHVFFAGSVAHVDLVRLLNLAKLFVMATRTSFDPPDIEGFGLVFLEAASCAKPVVGAWSGGIPDAVLDGTTGLLVDPLDPDELGRAVCRVLSDPGLAARLGRQGRARVLAELNWPAVTARLEEALATVVRPARPRDRRHGMLGS